MAKKGSSSHIKRLDAPKYFAIHRKEHKYVIKQNPGRHTLMKSVALSLLVNKMELAGTRSESNRIIGEGNISVNGKQVREPKFPVGLNDVISAAESTYMIGIDRKGHVQLEKMDKPKAQVYKVIGKYMSKGKQIMLRLHDGKSIKGSADAKVNDSVMLSNGGISKVMKLGIGSRCEVIDGVHVGTIGTIKGISEGNMHKQKSVSVEPQSGEQFETLVKNIIIVE
ncbi:MAG: hypothetical protein KGI06_03565 [Candidatus Micrarchaeota archaeon]|nr:hypothetical protein [Candidatus Micrarchaeota archaeon]